MDNCIFCNIVEGKIPSDKVYEDDKVFCFKDINPEAPIHLIIIPKKHISSINDIKNTDEELIGHIFFIAKKIAKELNIDENGYRIVTNCGKDAGQTVPHVHFHLLGGRSLNWPPG
ncbi:histidine triad (HIT) family protein [Clostridium sp. USBA 49]|jgi:histidine triad (HIT) family protein|uniref:histidine triad nucleotide-binding protein n=1 Tax=Clostridium TaxID=1485 RepID=UPI00099B1026|nr:MULTISPECIES: histidine triad nucleotide-binding protein [Clostridium]SKA75616.1 histidine triad (HIT) family protein [Clostridium sp. USBA 49]